MSAPLPVSTFVYSAVSDPRMTKRTIPPMAKRHPTVDLVVGTFPWSAQSKGMAYSGPILPNVIAKASGI